MGSRFDRKKMNVEGDRLSGLPDDLIHKIFSFIEIKQAIETSFLSSRWRYIWTSVPYLNFSNKDFCTVAKFSEFVTCVMSGRNNQTEVSSVRLTFHGKHSKVFVKRILDTILNYESSHNVQQLNITKCSDVKKIESPLSLFGSQSLKHLTLAGCTYKRPITTAPTLEMPTLTTLNLHRVTFYDDSSTDKCSGLFSNFANLKNLTLNNCNMVGGLNVVDIRHPGLSNLTLEGGDFDGCNVVTPQLKNLTIRYWRKMFMITAPDLASLRYEDTYYTLQLSGEIPHLEKADIWISHPSQDKANVHRIVYLLQQLSRVKFLTLNLEIIQLLSSSLEVISHQPSPFGNLKSLKIYPAFVSLEEKTQPKVTMSTEVKSYLLDGSPGATFTMVSHEEIRAKKLMRRLHILLNQWKENSETNMVDMKQDEAPTVSHMATVPEQVEVENQLNTNTKRHFWKRMTHINNQFKKAHKNSGHTISMLQKIEGALTKLPPTPYWARLQVSFSSLCAEAEASMDVMVDHLKMHCDKMSRLDSNELATTSQPSS